MARHAHAAVAGDCLLEQGVHPLHVAGSTALN